MPGGDIQAAVDLDKCRASSRDVGLGAASRQGGLDIHSQEPHREVGGRRTGRGEKGRGV